MMTVILPLPCGCVADTSTIRQRSIFIECPWCESTFDVNEYERWALAGGRKIMLQAQAPPLVRHGDDLLEALGHGAGDAILLRHSDGGKMVLFHGSADTLELLRN